MNKKTFAERVVNILKEYKPPQDIGPDFKGDALGYLEIVYQNDTELKTKLFDKILSEYKQLQQTNNTADFILKESDFELKESDFH